LFEASRYTDFFTKPRSQGGVKDDPYDVILTAIAAPPTPFASLVGDPTTQKGLYQPCRAGSGIDGHSCAVLLQHSCVAADNPALFGDPAVRMNAVLNAVKSHQTGSICDTDYGDTMGSIGSLMSASLMGLGCIGRALTTPTTPSCEVEIDGARVPSCSEVAGAGLCWEAVEQPACPAVADSAGGPPQELALELLEGGRVTKLSPDTAATARCRTTP
jgi:hypothetical protein